MVDLRVTEDTEGMAEDYDIPNTFERAFSDPKQFNKVRIITSC
jgi:hypothetical protein